MTIIDPPQRRKPQGFTREMRDARRGMGPSNNELFLARHQPEAEISRSEHERQVQSGVAAADPSLTDTPLTPVEVEHTRAGRVRMWALTSAGWVPRWIDNNGNHLSIAMKCGMSPVCGDCNGEHGAGLNDCPGRPPKRYRQCPVCVKKLFDPQPTGARAQVGTQAIIGWDEDGMPKIGTVAEDPNAISNDDLGNSTPETRTNEMVYRHMSAFHRADVGVFFPGRRIQEEQVRW